jgi:serine/threonine-protein kinase RsbW
MITVPAQAENVAVIRNAIGARAEELGMTDGPLDDLRTVVSEACANVVLHAYEEDEAPGPLEVEMLRRGERLSIVVRDRGVGIHSDNVTGGKPAGLRLGLLMIGALSSEFQLASARDKGTELTIHVPLAGLN